MRATRVRVHNYRSILDADVELAPYGLLVGPNGAGKSNLLASIRTFYDDIRFVPTNDFPQLPVADQESWVELTYALTPCEAATLKPEYLDRSDRCFTVRRYFQTSEKDGDGKPKTGGIFAYIDGCLSDSRFYGARNVQQAKLGSVVYIPAVSKLDDHTKLSGPSSLRELVNHVLKRELESSEQFAGLTTAFQAFRETLKGSSEGPMKELEGTITEELAAWGHSFCLDVRSLSVDELLKNLVAPKIIDGDLEKELEPGQFGHGFQRHLVYSLMMLAARYGKGLQHKPPSSKNFDPSLFWVLYEEPEAFLHPPQADVLNVGLRKFAQMDGQQVLITTHSPHFASRNLTEISSLVRLSREEKATQIGQITGAKAHQLFEENHDVVHRLEAAGVNLGPKDDLIELEAIKYSLWLDPLRASALFAHRVLLVEGPSERSLIGYLIDKERIIPGTGGVAVIDTMGKWNMHRFMNLLGTLRIRHAVLFDGDSREGKSDIARKKSEVFNTVIEESRNSFTTGMERLDVDLEDLLGMPKDSKIQPHQKPQYLLHAAAAEEIPSENLQRYVSLVQALIDPA